MGQLSLVPKMPYIYIYHSPQANAKLHFWEEEGYHMVLFINAPCNKKSVSFLVP